MKMRMLREGFDFQNVENDDDVEQTVGIVKNYIEQAISIKISDWIKDQKCTIYYDNDFYDNNSNITPEKVQAMFGADAKTGVFKDKNRDGQLSKYKSLSELLFLDVQTFKDFEKMCLSYNIREFESVKVYIYMNDAGQHIKLLPNFKYRWLGLKNLVIDEIPETTKFGYLELNKCEIENQPKIHVYAEDFCQIHGCYGMKSYGFIKSVPDIRILLDPYYNMKAPNIPKTHSFKGLPEGIEYLWFNAGDKSLPYSNATMKCSGIPKSVKDLRIDLEEGNLANFDFKDLDVDQYTKMLEIKCKDAYQAFYRLPSMAQGTIGKEAIELFRKFNITKLMYGNSDGVSYAKRDKLQKAYRQMYYGIYESFDFQNVEAGSKIEEEFKQKFHDFISGKAYCPIVCVCDGESKPACEISSLFADIVGGTLKIASDDCPRIMLQFRRMDDFAEFSKVLADCCIRKVGNVVVLKPAGVIGHSTKDDLKARVVEHTSCLVKFQTIRCDGAVFGDCQLTCGLFDTRNSTVSIGPNAKISADEIYYTGTLMNLSGPTGIDNISAAELTINTRGGVVLPPVVNKLEISLPKGLKTLNVELVNGKVNAENLQIRVLKPLSEINVKIEKAETAPIGLEFEDFEPEYIQGEIEFNLEDENTGKKVQIKKSDKDEKLAEKVNEIKNILTTYKKGIS